MTSSPGNFSTSPDFFLCNIANKNISKCVKENWQISLTIVEDNQKSILYNDRYEALVLKQHLIAFSSQQSIYFIDRYLLIIHYAYNSLLQE